MASSWSSVRGKLVEEGEGADAAVRGQPYGVVDRRVAEGGPGGELRRAGSSSSASQVAAYALGGVLRVVQQQVHPPRPARTRPRGTGRSRPAPARATAGGGRTGGPGWPGRRTLGTDGAAALVRDLAGEHPESHQLVLPLLQAVEAPVAPQLDGRIGRLGRTSRARASPRPPRPAPGATARPARRGGRPGGRTAGLLTPAVGVAAQGYRYRHASSEVERQQSRLLFWALVPALLVGLFVLSRGINASAFSDFEGRPIDIIPVALFRVFQPVFGIIPVALLVGLLRFRLWEVRRVLNRALVYGLLAAFVSVVYVGVVVLLGRTIGARDDNVVLSILATGLVAVAFQPVKERVQGLANRRLRPARHPVRSPLRLRRAHGGGGGDRGPPGPDGAPAGQGHHGPACGRLAGRPRARPPHRSGSSATSCRRWARPPRAHPWATWASCWGR